MIHAQLISRNGENLQTLIRSAIANGQIQSSETAKVAGGVCIRQKKHPGAINLTKTEGPLLATITCTNPSREWQLSEAFVGRLAYHFPTEISAVNIQFLSKE
jgi:hypothetical protein